MRRLTVTKDGLAAVGLKVAGGVVFVVVFLAVVVGGGVYRTDCVSDSGQFTRTWGLEGDLPYLWSPGDNRCRAHTLTRFVLGKVGIMGDVDH